MKSTLNNKTCPNCGDSFSDTTDFFYWRIKKLGIRQSNCKKCCKERSKAYRTANPEKAKAAVDRWISADPERAKRAGKNSYHKNKAKYKDAKRSHYINNREKYIKDANRRRAENPAKYREYDNRSGARYRATKVGNIRGRISAQINNAMRGKKMGRRWELLVGYTAKELVKHIEKQFADGMSWDNRNKWHIDHIIPIAAFNFTKPEHEDFRRCWALSNLQPMWAKENLRKGVSIDKPFQPSLAL